MLTSRKPSIGDSNDPTGLYAFNLSEIQVGKKEGDGEGEEVIHRLKEEINVVSGEISGPLDCRTSSHFGNPGPSLCCSYMSPPLNWRRRMTHFIKDLLANDEDPESILLLLEAEWPQMAGCVDVKWVKFCAWQGQLEELIAEAKEMEIQQIWVL
ncbi:MAG: hypothetical protein Q9163_004723 [Psora crenata]